MYLLIVTGLSGAGKSSALHSLEEQGYFCVEPSAYATRAQWQEWVDGALAYNPSAKASARRKPAAKKAPAKAATKATKKKRHSIFESDL